MNPEILFELNLIKSVQRIEVLIVLYVVLSAGIIFWAKQEVRCLRRKLVTLNTKLISQSADQNQATYRFEEIGRTSASLIHDLANPMTAVIIGLDELESEFGAEPFRQVRDGVNYIEECLASARTNLKNQNKKQTFCARSEVMRVIGFLEPKATEKGVGIKAHLSEIKLYGENSKFGQVVSNLLDNAIDACDSADSDCRKVEVSLRTQEKGHITLVVRDNGVGIPPGGASKIFQPFYSAKDGKSTGLGLSIAKRIVEEDFGGDLSLINSPQPGTVFAAKLPLR